MVLAYANVGGAKTNGKRLHLARILRNCKKMAQLPVDSRLVAPSSNRALSWWGRAGKPEIAGNADHLQPAPVICNLVAESMTVKGHPERAGGERVPRIACVYHRGKVVELWEKIR